MLALASVNASVYAQLLLFVLALFLLLFWLLFVTLFQLFHSLLLFACDAFYLPRERSQVYYYVATKLNMRFVCFAIVVVVGLYIFRITLIYVFYDLFWFVALYHIHRHTDRQADGQTGKRTDGRTRCCCVLAAFYFLFIIITAIMATICLACGFLRGESQVQGHCCWIAGLLVLLVTRFCLVCFFHFILYIFKTYCTKQTS